MMPFIAPVDGLPTCAIRSMQLPEDEGLCAKESTTKLPLTCHHQPGSASIKAAPNRPSRTAKTAIAGNANANLANKEGIQARWSQHL